MIITCNESSKSKIKVKVFTITFSRKRLMQFNVLRSSDRPTPPPPYYHHHRDGQDNKCPTCKCPYANAWEGRARLELTKPLRC